MLDDIKFGQIALLLKKGQMRQTRAYLNPSFLDRFVLEARDAGVPSDEAIEFIERIIIEITRENIDKKKREMLDKSNERRQRERSEKKLMG